jgi:diguanylate cyclase (GGDEF)-like protein
MRSEGGARGRALALVLVGAGGPDPSALFAGASGDVEVLEMDGTLPPRLPPAEVVLVAAPAPAGGARGAAGTARRDGAPWYWVGAPGGGAEWGRALDGELAPPLARETLLALATLHRRWAREQRGLRRAGRRLEELERRLALLAGTVRAAGTLLDPTMVSRFVMERASELIHSRRWRLYRADESGGCLRLEAYRDPENLPAPADALTVSEGLAGWVARSRQVVLLNRPRHDPRLDRELEWPGDGPYAVIAAPMISRGRVIGVAEFADPRGRRFRASDRVVVETFIEPAAIAMDNALLFRRLEEQTVTDDLTELYNARFMEGCLKREAKRACRYGSPVALLFLDLDGFKQVNDRLGHMAGSRTLVEFGHLLRDNVREIDVVARWGGDEFTVVLPETGLPGALEVAERIRAVVREHVFLAELGEEVRLSASIGVAAWPEHGNTPASLLAAADAAMYSVKYSGKDGVAAGASPVGPPAVV